MKEIQLTQGKVALVDDDMFEELNEYKWMARKDHNMFYAGRNSRKGDDIHKGYIAMHEMVISIPDGMICDHKDHNGLNNQRNNLRSVTNRQNNQNLRNAGSSIYPGVSWQKTKRKWRSGICINGKRKHLGYFKDELDAFQAYCNALESINETVIDEFILS